MTRKDRVRYEMLLRIRDFGKAHHELFPESKSGHQAFGIVARAIEQVDGHTSGTRSIVASRSRANGLRRLQGTGPFGGRRPYHCCMSAVFAELALTAVLFETTPVIVAAPMRRKA